MEKKTVYVVMYSINNHDGMVFTYGSYDTELNALKELPSIIKFISEKASQADNLERRIDYWHDKLIKLERDKTGNEKEIKEIGYDIQDLQSTLDSLSEYRGFDVVIDDVWVKPMDFYYDNIINP